MFVISGSKIPPRIPGNVRLYGMKFCPYALRARLVLLAKNIPHDIVYVDLQEKPEWLWELNPKGLFSRMAYWNMY